MTPAERCACPDCRAWEHDCPVAGVNTRYWIDEYNALVQRYANETVRADRAERLLRETVEQHAAEWSTGRDLPRLVAQAHEIEAALRGAAIGPCPLPEGVRRLVLERNAALAEIEVLKGRLAEVDYLRHLLRDVADYCEGAQVDWGASGLKARLNALPSPEVKRGR